MDAIAATELLARSTTLTSVGWIGYIIIGAIAGWLAGKIVKGGGSGILMNIVIGIVGALIGGFLLSFFLDTAGGRMVVHIVHRDPGSGDPAVDRRDGATQDKSLDRVNPLAYGRIRRPYAFCVTMGS